MTFKFVRERGQTRLRCEFGANPFGGSRDFYTRTKESQRQKQNLTQFTACGKMIGQL